MSEDLYQQWLNLPPGPRPPSHYALLGVAEFETDVAKLRAAAAERIKQIRKYTLKFPHESTKLLNEVATAEVCLSQPAMRAEYDLQLRAAQPSTTPPASADPSKTAPTSEATYELVADPDETRPVVQGPAAAVESRLTGGKPRPKSRPQAEERKIADEEPAEEAEDKAGAPFAVAAAVGGGIVVLGFLGALALFFFRSSSSGPPGAPDPGGIGDVAQVVPQRSNEVTPPGASANAGPMPPIPQNPPEPVKQVPVVPPGLPKSIVPPEEAKVPDPKRPPVPVAVPPQTIALVNGVGKVTDSILEGTAVHPLLGVPARVYAIPLEAFQGVEIVAESATILVPPLLALENSRTSSLVAVSPNPINAARAQITYAPPETGLYRVLVGYRGNQGGSFRLTVTARMPATVAKEMPKQMPSPVPGAAPGALERPPLRPIGWEPESVRGQFQVTRGFDGTAVAQVVQPVVLEANRVYRIELKDADGNVRKTTDWGPTLSLRDNLGRVLAHEEAGARPVSALRFQAPLDGVYTIIAASSRGSEVKYLLTIQQEAPGTRVLRKNLPVIRLAEQKNHEYRILGALGRHYDDRHDDEYAVRLSGGWTYFVDVATNQFKHETEVFDEAGLLVKVQIGSVKGFKRVPAAVPAVAVRTSVSVEKEGVYHIVVSSRGPLGPSRGIGLGVAQNSGNGRFDIRIHRGAASKKVGELKLVVSEIDLVKDGGKFLSGQLKAGEEVAFLFRYPGAKRKLTAEVKSDDFEPRVRLTQTDGKSPEGTLDEEPDADRLTFTATGPRIMHLRIASGNDRVGRFEIKLKLD